MITIKTTPNRFGVSLQGDYHDLNALYDSIAKYLELYMANNKFYPYHEYEYLLSLNYDIRHAYMGTRDVEIMENNASEVEVISESIMKNGLPAFPEKDTIYQLLDGLLSTGEPLYLYNHFFSE